MRISFQECDVRVDGRRILGPITCELTEHRIGVIGANGSGKSTFVRLINALRTPNSGIVHVDGKEVSRHARQLRREIAFCFTDPASCLVMPTPIEDVGLLLHNQADSLAVLERFGLADHAHDSVYTLSAGQQQLLALAGALAANPRLIVADEPTTLLDLAWRNRITKVLFNHEAQLVLVTHDLELAEQCERVLVFDNGRIVADSPGGQAVATYRKLVSGR